MRSKVSSRTSNMSSPTTSLGFSPLVSYLLRLEMQVSDLQRQQQLGVYFPHSLLQVLQNQLLAASDSELRKLGQDIQLERSNVSRLLQDQSRLLEGKYVREARNFVGSAPTASLLKF